MNDEAQTVSPLRRGAMLFGGSMLGAFPLGGLYAIAVWYSPHVMITLLLPLVLLFAGAWWTANLALKHQIEHRWIVGVAGLCFALSAQYVAWSVAAALSFPGLGLNAFRPNLLLEFARLRVEHGTIQIMGDNDVTTIAGAGLIVLWSAEAAVITIGSIIAILTLTRQAQPQRCPFCKAPVRTHFGLLRLQYPTDPAELAEQVKTQGVRVLDQLPCVSIDEDPHLRIDVVWCDSCSEAAVVWGNAISYRSTPGEVPFLCALGVSDDDLLHLNQRAKSESIEPESQDADE